MACQIMKTNSLSR